MSRPPSERLDPFLIPADELAPATLTPADAPPPPDDAPEGAAMQAAVRLAARRRGPAGLFWALAGLLVTLVVSVATYDYLTSLLQRFPLLGKLALVLTALLALIVAIQLVRELWAFRRLARIQSFHAEAAAARDRDAALALSRRLERFYSGRPELHAARARLAEQREPLLDPDAILELTERTLLEPLDAQVRREIEAASRSVATATALIPIAFADVLAALSQNVRMIRRIAETYGAHAGFFGSWRLLRLVAAHLLATGLVAVGDDLMGSVAGGHVLARLSKRFGEGVMNGALTARVGVAAIDVCRPLPFAALPRPKVSNLTGRALAGLFSKE